jgi:hypothetical protein
LLSQVPVAARLGREKNRAAQLRIAIGNFMFET